MKRVKVFKVIPFPLIGKSAITGREEKLPPETPAGGDFGFSKEGDQSSIFFKSSNSSSGMPNQFSGCGNCFPTTSS
jgi:hypothetical protein